MNVKGSLNVLAAVFASISLVVVACSSSTPPAQPKQEPAQSAPAKRESAAPTKQAASPAKQESGPTAQPKKEAAQPKQEPAKPKQPVNVKVAVQGSASDGAIFIAIEKGYFQQEGLNVEPVNFSSASEMLPALSTGQVEVAGIGGNAATLNAVARDIGIRAVADKGSTPTGFGFLALVVRKDLFDSGKVKDYSDLKGLKIALTPPLNGTANAIDLDKALKKGGLTSSDLTVTLLSFGDMPAALAGKSIDAAIAIEPGITSMIDKGIAVRWKGIDEVYPGQQIAVINFGPKIIKEMPDQAKAFMVGYVRGARDYNDAFVKNKNKKEIATILSKRTSIKDPAVFEKIIPAGINPDGYMNVQALKDDQDWYFSNKMITQKVDIDTFVDHQFVEYAIQKLGKYSK
ncbi:MAG: ABC transporter substrate-binding protein [Chloroflexi bacterium]|nr:ABC transporter substrate-binding protein [Chloroflexota bacterium]